VPAEAAAERAGWTVPAGAVIMWSMDNVVRIPIGGGEGSGAAAEPPRQPSPPPDLLTVAARAAVGLVALAVESAIQIVRRASGSPEGGGAPESIGVVTGAALGFTIEAARTAISLAELGLRTAGPPTTFVIDTFFDAPRRAGQEMVVHWNESWREDRPEARAAATAVAVEATRQAVDLVLEQLDLTQIVLDHVDLDRVVAAVDMDAVLERLDLDSIVARVDLDRVAERIDLDAVAERLDVERVVARLDLAKLSLEVIERIDLPEIIRSSTGTVASEGVRVVRMQTFGADRAIAGIVNRMLGRTAQDQLEEPSSTDDADG
jgi:hypothetical protein